MKQIADFLKNFRKKKGLTEQEIVDKTTLTPVVIRLIESGDFESIGAEFYIKSFLGQYCKVIGLTDSETDEIIKQVIKGISSKYPAEERNIKKSGRFLLWFFSGLLIFLIALFFVLRGEKSGNDLAKNTHFSRTAKESESLNLQSASHGKIREKLKQKSEQIPESVTPGDKPAEISKTESQADNSKQKSAEVSNKENKENNSKEIVKETKNQKAIVLNNQKVMVRFESKCMCWVNIAFNNKVIKDFILKENEKFTLAVPKGAVLTIGNAGCVTVYFNNRLVKLKGEKVVRNLMVE